MSSDRAKRNSPSGTSMSELYPGRKWWKQIRRLLQISQFREGLLTEQYNQKTYEQTLEMIRAQYGAKLQKRELRMRMLWLRMIRERPECVPSMRRPMRRTIGALIVETQRNINQSGMKRWRAAIKDALTVIPTAWKKHEKVRAARLFAYLKAEGEEQRMVLALLIRLHQEEKLLSMSQINEYATDWQERLLQMLEYFPQHRRLLKMLYSSHWVRRCLSRSESRRMRYLGRKMRRLGLGD
uniref:NS4 n=1 Tax=Bukakata virus TaxID=2547355 RepID=A0A482A4J7_9REOV|nr:NS4 [Bukakata virus]